MEKEILIIDKEIIINLLLFKRNNFYINLKNLHNFIDKLYCLCYYFNVVIN